MIVDIIIIIFSFIFYSVFIKPFYIALKEQKEFRNYMKTVRVVTTFIDSEEYKNLDETKKINITNNYLELLKQRLTTKTDYKKMNDEVKEIFKDIIPEFKSSDREKKLKILLK